MKKSIIILSFLGCLCFGKSTAQDHHFSQFDASGVILNPALTGHFGAGKEDYRAGLQHRDQWRGLSRRPFTRSAAWFEGITQERYGYGAYIQMDKAGSSGYSTLNFMVSGAYEIMNAQYRRKHQLTVGLQLGIIQRAFDPGGHMFDSQYVGGDQVFDASLPSGENFVRTTLLGFDANMGVSYVNFDKQKRVRPFGGIMFAHISRSRQSFTDAMDRAPMRLATHGGAEIDAAEKLTLIPSVLYMAQGGARQLNMNLLGGYQLGDSEYTIYLGGGYRNKDAVILQTGVKYRTTMMRISYDRNTSSLEQYTGGMGGWEISLIHGFFKGK